MSTNLESSERLNCGSAADGKARSIADAPGFTPGPWHTEKHGGAYEIWPKDKGQPHAFIARVMLRDDARIISSAPDLLEACQLAMEEFNDRYDGAPDAGYQW